jgi:hypothetical protein
VNIVPQVRATATAAFLLGATMLGLALGPTADRLSTDFGSLKVGLVGVLAVVRSPSPRCSSRGAR